MPDKMSREKIDLLRAYGAEVVVAPTDVPPDSPQSYYRVADRLTEEIPGAFQPNQYVNQANPQTHYESTGPELWRADRRAASPTSSSASAPAARSPAWRATCKERNPRPRGRRRRSRWARSTPAARRTSTPTSSRASARTSGRRPSTRRSSTATSRVSDRDSFLTTRRLAELEGILAGGSCGLAVHAALEVAARDRRPRGDDRGHPPRRRPRLPVEDLQRRVDGASTASSSATSDRTVGDVLRRQAGRGRDPAARRRADRTRRSRDAIALLHEHRVSQLPVVCARTPARSSARSASAGCSGTRRTTRRCWTPRSSR